MSTLDQAGSDKITIMADVADVFKDSTMEAAVSSQGPVVSEVAIAAADSYLPVQALQYVIDAVHTYTGLNWWAAIILTTLLIRSATVPLLINQLKATSKLTVPKLVVYLKIHLFNISIYLIITKAYSFTHVAANEASFGRNKGRDGGEGKLGSNQQETH
ncbi:mitochondrial inner membrane protein OXA1-like [Trifolium pratense]|uniref:Mitochondrial inner membrane protein OXA1-like n=1 Tax=Trifolium pratense TaxID=57577 RepID=A0A2K3PPP1_TRIPR|nr:mitochondrial inner membrane protein OXA1-like [Trifolium pratense]